MKKASKVEEILPATKNGHIKQLKPEQQLALGRIQRRVLQYQVQANQLKEQAQAAVDQARAADMEFGKAVQAYAAKLGVNLEEIDTAYLFDKLQFKKKEATA